MNMHLTRAMQTPGTWAGGTTRMIYAYPPDQMRTSANAQFWIGTATIERMADYSYFPGRERVHMPIRGNGLRLEFQDPPEVIVLNTFAQHRFDGARQVRAELADGPVEAFNLIAAADVAAEAQALHGVGSGMALGLPSLRLNQPSPDLAVVRAVYVVAGVLELQVESQVAMRLEAEDAFVLPPRAAQDVLGERVEMHCLADAVDLVIATVMFDPTIERR